TAQRERQASRGLMLLVVAALSLAAGAGGTYFVLSKWPSSQTDSATSSPPAIASAPRPPSTDKSSTGTKTVAPASATPDSVESPQPTIPMPASSAPPPNTAPPAPALPATAPSQQAPGSPSVPAAVS